MTTARTLMQVQSDNWKNNDPGGVDPAVMADIGYTPFTEMPRVLKVAEASAGERLVEASVAENIGEVACGDSVSTDAVATKDKAMQQVDHLRNRQPFNINDIPSPKETGSWGRAARSIEN